MDPNKKEKGKDDGKSLGVLYTGYLEKKNPVKGSYQKRFVVLTQTTLHWFIRDEGYDLFGAERGQVALGSILTVKVSDVDSTIFEIRTTDHQQKFFRASSTNVCEEWVSAIRSAIKTMTKKPNNRRGTLSNIRNAATENDSGDENDVQASDITVLLVSLKATIQQGGELVIARNPDWHRVITIPSARPGDTLILSLSNGGQVVFTYEQMYQRVIKEAAQQDFEVAVQNVPLASSVRLSLATCYLANSSSSQADNSSHHSSSSTSSTTTTSQQRPSSSWSACLSFLGQLSDRLLSVLSGLLSSVGLSSLLSSPNSSLSDFLAVVTSDRDSAICSVLSLLVLMAGLSSLTCATWETSLLFLFAGSLSGYNLRQTVEQARYSSSNNSNNQRVAGNRPSSSKGGGGQRSSTSSTSSPSPLPPIRMILYKHTFTSPDAPINDPVENEIPRRFLVGCEMDKVEARRRWEITKHWRETEGINHILQEPQPYFSLIKTMYPHYHAGRGKAGHVVFYERPGEFQHAQLAARGVTMDDLLRHWLFTTEYQWQILCQGDELAKSIAVIDIQGVSMGDLAGENLSFLKKTISYANLHYPERSYAIAIVNAPWYFSMLWKLVKPLVNENTQKKVRILSAKDTLTGLQEIMDLDQIPEYYGGGLSCGDGKRDCCRWQSPESVAINEFVRKLNNDEGGTGGGGAEGGGEGGGMTGATATAGTGTAGATTATATSTLHPFEGSNNGNATATAPGAVSTGTVIGVIAGGGAGGGAGTGTRTGIAMTNSSNGRSSSLAQLFNNDNDNSHDHIPPGNPGDLPISHGAIQSNHTSNSNGGGNGGHGRAVAAMAMTSSATSPSSAASSPAPRRGSTVFFSQDSSNNNNNNNSSYNNLPTRQQTTAQAALLSTPASQRDDRTVSLLSTDRTERSMMPTPVRAATTSAPTATATATTSNAMRRSSTVGSPAPASAPTTTSTRPVGSSNGSSARTSVYNFGGGGGQPPQPQRRISSSTATTSASTSSSTNGQTMQTNNLYMTPRR